MQITIGDHLRDWRQRRRLSQLDLAVEAEISTRHLSFLETGRAQPSREMVLRLAEFLDVPLRERNALLLAAGFAPAYPERSLDDPELAPARRMVELVLQGHEPYPAIAVDRHWNLVAHNRVVPLFLADIDPALLAPPVNVLRLSLHPGGFAPRLANAAQWRAHILERLRRMVAATGDPGLAELATELRAYPLPAGTDEELDFSGADVAVPFRYRSPLGTLSFLSTVTVFGSPLDVTLSELALEAFYPADAETAAILGLHRPAVDRG
jgi:transcriptional regulator with XRE-family HTH domain